MRSIIILGSALISTAAAAEAPAPAAPNPSERVCVVVSETGTRLGRVRRCMSRQEEQESRRERDTDLTRQQIDRRGCIPPARC